MRTYTFTDQDDVRRKLSAMLHKNCRCRVGVYNAGWTLGVVVANAKVSKLYEFGWTGMDDDSPGQPAPALTDLALLQIVSEWKTGEPDEKAEPSISAAAGPVAKEVRNREEFLEWARTAKTGSQCLYHRGSLANYRKDAPARLIHLERLQDEAKPAHPRPAGEAVEIQNIRDHLELIQTVTQMQQAGLVTLTQRRTVEGREGDFIYYAVKKGR